MSFFKGIDGTLFSITCDSGVTKVVTKWSFMIVYICVYHLCCLLSLIFKSKSREYDAVINIKKASKEGVDEKSKKFLSQAAQT